jgi:hypothetical protein
MLSPGVHFSTACNPFHGAASLTGRIAKKSSIEKELF